MAQGRASPQKLTPAQQDAYDALVSMKIPKPEAADLIARAQGNDAGEILHNALRLRAGAGQRIPPPQGAALHSVQGPPVAPVAPQAPQLPAPQAQQQIPGFGPPGGPAAAPSAEQLQQSQQPAATPFWQRGFLGRMLAPAPAMKPSWYTGTPEAPAPAPVARQPSIPTSPVGPVAQTQAITTQAPRLALPAPAPVKPRVRVKAAGARVPEAPAEEETKPSGRQGKEPPPEPYDRAAYASLPRVRTQEEVDKLSKGSHFINDHTGEVYRKD